jgi:hypothetical protein
MRVEFLKEIMIFCFVSNLNDSLLKKLFLLTVITFSFSTVNAEDLIVPIHKEPKHHLVYDGKDIQIMDVKIGQGDMTLYHIHNRPILYVSIESSYVDSQAYGEDWKGLFKTDDDLWKSGDVAFNIKYVNNEYIHRVRNTEGNLFRLIAVLNKSNLLADDAEHSDSLLPGKVEVNNPYFHQSRLMLDKGKSVRWEDTGYPVVFVQIGHGSADIQYDDGTQKILSSSGEYIVEDSNKSFNVTNSGNQSLTYIVVELH